MIEAPPPLACPRLLAQFIASNVSDAAKAQLLFVLAAVEDVALAAAYQKLVVPSVAGVSRRVPAKADIVAFLEDVAQTRTEVAKWTKQTRLRWAEGFRLVLREVGIITGTSAGREALSPPVVRDEPICLLCHALADIGVSGWPILRHELTKLLLVTDADAIRAARALQDRGWWTYAQSGEFVEFRRNHGSLEEWMNHGLGQ